MQFHMEPDAWEARVATLAQRMINTPTELPPLIVEYRRGKLVICDGNTRYAVMQRRGWQACWVVIWYNSEEDYRTHHVRLQGGK